MLSKDASPLLVGNKMGKKFTRIVVIAPTRSTCVSIHTVLENNAIPSTLLTQLKGEEINDAVSRLTEGGFGIVAGTGTGKTVAIRDICHQVLGASEILIDVVTREHEATEKTWRSNVLVVTPGVAVNWLKHQRLTSTDLIVVDEIHQTTEHLELAIAFAKREGCTFVWMSATIDPETYREYLGARTVIECDAFDPIRKATVEVSMMEVPLFIGSLIPEIKEHRKGVAVFVPTRAIAEELSRDFSERGIHTEFYHGGESAEKLRPFLTGKIEKPFMIFMTIAGASSLNVVGLDTVVIVDQWYTEVVRSGGVKSLEKLHLGANELLQMGGRVNGRAVGGMIHILSDREVDFHALRPEAPRFVLGGDLERVALTCAKLGIDARELDLIGHIDHAAYGRVVERFAQRGLIVQNGETHLTALGERVESLPVEPHWGEMLVAAEDAEKAKGTRELFEIVSVVSCADELYKLTRRNWDSFGSGVCVRGSDHLTSYNIVASALRQFGYIRNGNGGSEYALRGDWIKGYDANRTFGEFSGWCHKFGFMAKEIKNILHAMRSVYRQLRLELPDPGTFANVQVGADAHKAFVDVLARVQSLDFVNEERNSGVGTVWAAQGSMASANSTLGTIRRWKDKRGYLRASMEGTEIPEALVRRYATAKPYQVLGMSADGERVRTFFTSIFAGEPVGGFDRELDPEDVPPIYKAELPRIFASWLANRRDHGNENLGRVLRANAERQEGAERMNLRSGVETFMVFSPQEVRDWYELALAGARCVREVDRPYTLLLPELDNELVGRVFAENPDTILVLGRRLAVDYRESSLGAPSVVLPDEMVKAKSWIQLPDEGVFLPGGRKVEVKVPCGYYNAKLSTDIPRLKAWMREHFNYKQWTEWYDRPEIALPDPTRDEADFSITTTSYGKCVVSGENLIAFGAVGVKINSFDQSLSTFKGQWFLSREEAESSAHFSKQLFEEFRAKARKEDERAAAEKQKASAKNDATSSGGTIRPTSLAGLFGGNVRTAPSQRSSRS
jgi:ATP-dependent helicase HrpA